MFAISFYDDLIIHVFFVIHVFSIIHVFFIIHVFSIIHVHFIIVKARLFSLAFLF